MGASLVALLLPPLCQVSPFDIEPSRGQMQPLGECRVTVSLRASRCLTLQTALELEVENGVWR